MKNPSAFVLATIAFLSGSAISAGATAVTVGAYYEETSDRQSTSVPTVRQCLNAGNRCYFIFNVIPSGKQLLITDVSCDLYLSDAANTIAAMKILHYAGTTESDRKHSFPVVRGPNINQGAMYFPTGRTRHLVKANERPVVELHTSSAISLINGSCTITGKTGSPPIE